MPLDPAAGGRHRLHAKRDVNGPDERVIVHLGMTGDLRVWESEETPVKQTHFRALLDSGLELRYDDALLFGRRVVGSLDELLEVRAFPARLGPERIHGRAEERRVGK